MTLSCLTLCHRFCSAETKYDIMSNVLIVEELRLGDKAFGLLSYIFANVRVIRYTLIMCFHIKMCGTYIAKYLYS
jgi:hypothetical protein